MAKMMSVALPVLAIGAAAFTGGSSLLAMAGDSGLLGADAMMAGAGVASGAATAGASAAADATAAFAPAATSSWFGSTVAAVSPYLKTAATVAQVGGTLEAAAGAKAAGQAQQTEANYQANQLDVNAGQQQAAAEQSMVQQNKQTAYVLSNAQAAAAAGGGSATDPTVTTNMNTIAGEGRYRALTDLYQGNAAAQADTNQAAALRYGGQQAATAGNTKMYSTILSGASSLFDRYGSPDDLTKKTNNYGGYLATGN